MPFPLVGTSRKPANELFVLDNRALVVDDLPAFGSVLPDRRSARSAPFVLDERICQKVDIRPQFSTKEIEGLPTFELWRGGPPLQFVEHRGRAHVPAVQDQVRAAQLGRDRGRAGLPAPGSMRVGEDDYPHHDRRPLPGSAGRGLSRPA